MADGTNLISVAASFADRVDRRPFQLLDTTDNASHRGIEESGQTYATVSKWEFGATVTISTCEGSVDIEAGDFDDLVKAYIGWRGL